jgi:hypothetical protein
MELEMDDSMENMQASSSSDKPLFAFTQTISCVYTQKSISQEQLTHLASNRNRKRRQQAADIKVIMSDGNNNNPMKRGPTEISHAADNAEKRQKVLGSSREESDKAASQKLVQDFLASFESSVAKERAGEEEEPSSLSNEERKDRKRKINRLSAQRKRVRERVQLDTLTDQYAQLSYRNEALKGDNGRLSKLISSLKGTLSEAKQQESIATTSQQHRGAYLLEKLGPVEKVRQSLLTSVLEGQPARLNSFDPATGSAASSTTENPFAQTTNLLVAKVKVAENTRQTLITALRSVQQAQTPALASASMHAGNVFTTVAANRAAPQRWHENPASFHSHFLSALQAPASAPAPPPPPPPAPAATNNAMALLQLLAVLGGSTGNAQPSQVDVFNSAQIPNGNVASNCQGFQGAPLNMLQPASVSGAVFVCSQPTRISPPSVVAACTTNTPQPPVGGSMNNDQAVSLAAILQLLQSR